MTLHIYRVVVRGRFDSLDEATRQALLDAAGDHDVLTASFTKEGTLVYDASLTSFSFRCEVRANGDDAAEVEQKVTEEAQALAVTRLERAGIGYRALRVELNEMSGVWKRKGKDVARGAPRPAPSD